MIFKVHHPEWGWLSIIPGKTGPGLWVRGDTVDTASPLNFANEQSLKRMMRKHWAKSEVGRVSVHIVKEQREKIAMPIQRHPDSPNKGRLVRLMTPPLLNGEYVHQPADDPQRRVRVLRSLKPHESMAHETAPMVRVIDVDTAEVSDVYQRDLFIRRK